MLFIQGIKCKISYRMDFIISTFGILFANISGFVAVYILFQSFNSILGWNYYEMLFLYGFSLIIMTLQSFFENNWNLLQHLRSGTFIKYYFRPINLYFYFVSEIFDVKGIGQCIFGIVSLIYAWYHLMLPVTVVNTCFLLIGFCSASLIMIAIMNIAAACGFWLIGYNFVMILTDRIKDFGRYPITIFGKIFRFIFTFIIPIGFLAYYESLYILRPGSVPILTYISPIFALIFFYISNKIWMFGANSYTSTGS